MVNYSTGIVSVKCKLSGISVDQIRKVFRYRKQYRYGRLSFMLKKNKFCRDHARILNVKNVMKCYESIKLVLVIVTYNQEYSCVSFFYVSLNSKIATWKLLETSLHSCDITDLCSTWTVFQYVNNYFNLLPLTSMLVMRKKHLRFAVRIAILVKTKIHS